MIRRSCGNALLAGAMLAGLSAASYAQLSASPAQIALARATCTNVMRISDGFVAFYECVTSLSGTLATRSQSQIINQNYDDCRKEGREDNTAQFASCMLGRNVGSGGEGHSSAVSGSIADYTKISFPGSDKSYSASRWEERRGKVEHSCAQLGSPPGSAAFASCVTNLESALQSVEHND